MGHILHLDLASVNVLKPRFDNKEDKVWKCVSKGGFQIQVRKYDYYYPPHRAVPPISPLLPVQGSDISFTGM